MKPKNLNRATFLEYKSWRHHYIPQFILKAFTNSEGLFYVYDKQRDEILKGQKSPKGYFFEKDRNTIETIDGEKSTILENVIYHNIDNDCSKTVKHFQQTAINEIYFTTEDIAHFLLFQITLLWRIPSFDFAAEDVLDRTKILSKKIEHNVLKQDSAFRKLQRAALFNHHIDEIVKNQKKGNKSVQIHHSEKQISVIGDNPILFRTPPSVFGEFDHIDSFMAISSKRIYSSSSKAFSPLTLDNRVKYNAGVIHQSENYVAAGDLRALEISVEYYRSMKANGLESEIINQFFKGLKYAE